MPATTAEAGIVRIQAMTILPATPQRTAESRSDEPTPMIALEMTWVVETGIPKCDAVRMIVAAVVSAAKPWTGSSLTTRWPIVLMMRQPPAAVPKEMAVAARTITHSGIADSAGSTPAAIRARVMIPIVFWASFEPWLNAMNAAETSWRRRKRSLIRWGFARLKTFRRMTMSRNPPTTPAIGEPTSGRITLLMTPSTLIAPAPTDATTAPSSPPIRAWLDELGMPNRHVTRFQTIAPTSAAATIV